MDKQHDMLVLHLKHEYQHLITIDWNNWNGRTIYFQKIIYVFFFSVHAEVEPISKGGDYNATTENLPIFAVQVTLHLIQS